MKLIFVCMAWSIFLLLSFFICVGFGSHGIPLACGIFSVLLTMGATSVSIMKAKGTHRL